MKKIVYLLGMISTLNAFEPGILLKKLHFCAKKPNSYEKRLYQVEIIAKDEMDLNRKEQFLYDAYFDIFKDESKIDPKTNVKIDFGMSNYNHGSSYKPLENGGIRLVRKIFFPLRNLTEEQIFKINTLLSNDSYKITYLKDGSYIVTDAPSSPRKELKPPSRALKFVQARPIFKWIIPVTAIVAYGGVFYLSYKETLKEQELINAKKSNNNDGMVNQISKENDLNKIKNDLSQSNNKLNENKLPVKKDIVEDERFWEYFAGMQ